MADERNAVKEMVKSYIPGTQAHHQRSSADAAYSVANATGKNVGPHGSVLGTETGTAQQPVAAGTPAQQQQQQLQQGQAPGAAGEMLRGLGMAPK